MYRVLVLGAGRIGASYHWHDQAYTHPGAIRANSDRAQLVGFVEPDRARSAEAMTRWEVPVYAVLPLALDILKPDIVCVAVNPERQREVMDTLAGCKTIKAVYCEKPFMGGEYPFPVQVNYLRRADPLHRILGSYKTSRILYVAAKDDIHTRCHFEDLAKWWDADLQYIPFNGPNAYVLYEEGREHVFRNGGVDGGECMAALLRNLIDHLDLGTPLWSPAYV